jgi:UDP-3-O-[3-hydroxymyristoyl] glucosamine N-acyltransferase
MEQKYRILPDRQMALKSVTLYRIQALRDIYDENQKLIAEAGDIGGFIEKEENLSQEGSSWIKYSAIVCENARVFDNATVLDYARVGGNAKIFENARVGGSTKVFEDAEVFGNARTLHCAKIYGNAKVGGNAIIYDEAEIFGNAVVSGDVHVCKKAKLSQSAEGSGKIVGNHGFLWIKTKE